MEDRQTLICRLRNDRLFAMRSVEGPCPECGARLEYEEDVSDGRRLACRKGCGHYDVLIRRVPFACPRCGKDADQEPRSYRYYCPSCRIQYERPDARHTYCSFWMSEKERAVTAWVAGSRADPALPLPEGVTREDVAAVCAEGERRNAGWV